MFELFDFQFHLYGVILAGSLWVGFSLAQKILHRERVSISSDSLFLWIVLCGVIGARAYHVFTDWSLYENLPLMALAIWEGGLGVVGAVIGGVIGMCVGLKRQKKLGELSKVLDAGFLVLPLSQAIGRWGNYFNQELYGRPTDLPWGVYIEPMYRVVQFKSFSHFHPLFLYESILTLLLFGFLFFQFYIRKWRIGQYKIMGVYLMGYSIIRFSLEFLRTETAYFGNNSGFLSIMQWLMIVAFCSGLYFFFIYQHQQKYD